MRKMVSRIEAIRPTQFSALKVLDPLDEKEERGEDDDRQADTEQVRHGGSLGCAVDDELSQRPEIPR
jgi:hypothetical protein